MATTSRSLDTQVGVTQAHSQTRLPSELWLEIYEHLDAASMMQFSSCSKTVASLTSQFERSICKRRTAALEPKQSKLAILSSNKVDRSIIPADTYGFIRELELRHARIDYMLVRSGFLDLSAPPGLRPLTCGQQLWHLVPLLKQALGYCDDIADIAATSTTGTSRPCPSVRSKQVAYIQGLTLEGVSCLLYLLIILSIGYIQQGQGPNGSIPIPPDNPIDWEIVTVFEEGILRHGSWYLWAHIAASAVPGGRLEKLKRGLMAAGLKELTDWETGKDRVAAYVRQWIPQGGYEVCVSAFSI
ncbi:uncharacterized protein B0I36DRAFT_330530 [Microdochium trichocladiopsis]|uniref:F-box domain-containing protein n=1 Tax=Microdochium trichocladiopsis TaxID=1682393 RepID=A0A9P8Y3A2_9PEZI|nr:uncharacterized protein B0I36DRAFT_330530 [Microdochium trichocladiopsis]KAH7026378.1 hypothetical protein B0I36DRAFT_330530 [Microdochium trichocladiopsis]